MAFAQSESPVSQHSDFDLARGLLLRTLAEEDGFTLIEVLDAYCNIPAFKYRIDLAAQNLTAPEVSKAIH